jgi:hypothetical protein
VTPNWTLRTTQGIHFWKHPDLKFWLVFRPFFSAVADFLTIDGLGRIGYNALLEILKQKPLRNLSPNQFPIGVPLGGAVLAKENPEGLHDLPQNCSAWRLNNIESFVQD